LNCRAGTGPACLARRARREGEELFEATKKAASHRAIEPSASPPAMIPSGCAPVPASDPTVPQASDAKRSGAEALEAEGEAAEAGRRSGESEARSTEKTCFFFFFRFGDL